MLQGWAIFRQLDYLYVPAGDEKYTLAICHRLCYFINSIQAIWAIGWIWILVSISVAIVK